jgi:glycerol uptake facilitator protein
MTTTASPPAAPACTALRPCLAEGCGTFLLVLFGIGSVHAAVFTGAQSGIWQIAVVWGAAVALAIYAFGPMSGAHINPAVTIAFALFRGFPWRRVPGYVAAQVAGAFAAAALLHALFSGAIARYETANGIVRGAPGSERSAMAYGEYFPNPGLARGADAAAAVNAAQAMAAEAIGTALLAFFVFSLTDSRRRPVVPAPAVPLLIGLALAIIISVLAPLTQAGFNPARDLGPRLFAWCAGWGRVAVPGPRGGFLTVYVLSPVLGAAAGGWAWERLRRAQLRREGACA